MGEYDIDLVLINPGDRLEIYQSLGQSLAAAEPPIWAGLMATFVRRRGFSVTVVDANAECLTPVQTAERVASINPRLTALVVYGHNPSASTQVMPSAGAIATAIKLTEPERKVIMVGGHVAALPERSLQEESTDFVAQGEGLYTLTDLLEGLKNHRQPDLSKVRGLIYWNDGGLEKAPPAPLVMNLDEEMPGIAWDLLPMDLYRAHNWHCYDGLERQPYGAIYTTLGCPFKCSFCCIQAPFKSGERVLGMRQMTNSYRFWSPEVIGQQLDTLVTEYGVRNLKVADEMFVLNRKHVDAVCDHIIERGYDLNIWAYARVDTVKTGMLDKLKKAGFNWLGFGIEAASEEVRDDVQKGYGAEDITRTLDEVSAAGIYTAANYIFGLPEDDYGTMQQTLDLSMELNTEYANFYCTMAYPGSTLYAQALEKGWRLPDSWLGYSQHSVDTLPLQTKYLSGQEVLKFRDEAWNRYFGNVDYLDLTERRFGSETREHIVEMSRKTLHRNHYPAGASAAHLGG